MIGSGAGGLETLTKSINVSLYILGTGRGVREGDGWLAYGGHELQIIDVGAAADGIGRFGAGRLLVEV